MAENMIARNEIAWSKVARNRHQISSGRPHRIQHTEGPCPAWVALALKTALPDRVATAVNQLASAEWPPTPGRRVAPNTGKTSPTRGLTAPFSSPANAYPGYHTGNRFLEMSVKDADITQEVYPK